jgi:hypothetical protein
MLPHWSGAAGDEAAPQEDIGRFQMFDIWKLSRFGVTFISIRLDAALQFHRRVCATVGRGRPLSGVPLVAHNE